MPAGHAGADPQDVLLTREVFQQRRMGERLHVASDGVVAMDFLHRSDGYSDAPRPGLILLDLNKPRRNGLEVLADLKSDAEPLTIPVVVFTSSQAEQDIVSSYALHANAFVTKPIEYDKFVAALGLIDDFYRSLVQLPN
ncbi:MAG TPA: response regulator [Streptosporangiaceae bacterium]|nr:response regulator [Streptosporangiaceae bacterium]